MIVEYSGESSPMTRGINRGLMVTWINADLFERAACDVRKSIVFLDERGLFSYALPVGAELPPESILAALERGSDIRFWSFGVV